MLKQHCGNICNVQATIRAARDDAYSTSVLLNMGTNVAGVAKSHFLDRVRAALEKWKLETQCKNIKMGPLRCIVFYLPKMVQVLLS